MKKVLKTITAIATVLMATVGYGQQEVKFEEHRYRGHIGGYTPVEGLQIDAQQYASAVGANATVRQTSQTALKNYTYNLKKEGNNYIIFITVPSMSLDISYDNNSIGINTTGRSYTIEGAIIEVTNKKTGYKKKVNLTVNGAWEKGKTYKATAFTQIDVSKAMGDKKPNLSFSAQQIYDYALQDFKIRVVNNGKMTASSFPTAEVQQKIKEIKGALGKKTPETKTIVLDSKTTPVTEKIASEPEKPKPTTKSNEKTRRLESINDVKIGDIYALNPINHRYSYIKVQNISIKYGSISTRIHGSLIYDYGRKYSNDRGVFIAVKDNGEISTFSNKYPNLFITSQEEKDWVEACIKSGVEELGEEDEVKYEEFDKKYGNERNELIYELMKDK